MSKHGQGPRLLGRFAEGRVEEFIHARFVFSIYFFLKMFFLEIFTLSTTDLCDPEIFSLIAAKLREFQSLDMPGPKTVILWDRMRNWLSEAKLLCSVKDIKKFSLDTLEEEINMLEKELSQGSQELRFVTMTFLAIFSFHIVAFNISSSSSQDYEYSSYRS
ncbi:hypothetical protein UlMin_027983 [Ulmus minor]